MSIFLGAHEVEELKKLTLNDVIQFYKVKEILYFFTQCKKIYSFMNVYPG